MGIEKTMDELHYDSPVQLDNNDPIDPSVDLVTDPDYDNSNDIDPEIADGTEQFLAQYGIVGGLVSLQNESGEIEDRHYHELTPEEQFNVLTSLAQKGRTSEEEKYALTPEEIAVINSGRKSKKPITEIIEELATRRANELLAFKQVATLSFKDMDDDAIYLHSLKDANPDADTDTLRNDLDIAKQLSTYKNNVISLRKQFEKDQIQLASDRESAVYNASMAQIDNDRKLIVQAVAPLTEIAGWELTNDEKNVVLEQLLEINDQFDSLFVSEVFSDPLKMFKAAWMYNNAEEKFDQMANYYKGQINEAYLKGKNDALGTTNSNNVTQNRIVDKKKSTVPVRKENTKVKTLDELHND